MVDALLLITQITSLIALILVLVATIIYVLSLSKFSDKHEFKKSLIFFVIYLISFMLAVGFMSLYHWLDSEIMEEFWYIMLNISLSFGIVSGMFSLSFWKRLSFNKK